MNEIKSYSNAEIHVIKIWDNNLHVMMIQQLEDSEKREIVWEIISIEDPSLITTIKINDDYINEH